MWTYKKKVQLNHLIHSEILVGKKDMVISRLTFSLLKKIVIFFLIVFNIISLFFLLCTYEDDDDVFVVNMWACDSQTIIGDISFHHPPFGSFAQTQVARLDSKFFNLLSHITDPKFMLFVIRNNMIVY